MNSPEPTGAKRHWVAYAMFCSGLMGYCLFHIPAHGIAAAVGAAFTFTFAIIGFLKS